MNKSELIEECKSKKLKHSGGMVDLLYRLRTQSNDLTALATSGLTSTTILPQLTIPKNKKETEKIASVVSLPQIDYRKQYNTKKR
jgi:hypothetical protein